jgi:hypothetical protein
MTVKIVGELEVDIERGVIYFHNYTNGISNLRICGLREKTVDFTVKSQLDITIPIVMRSEMGGINPRPVPQRTADPRTFFLGDQHTTHISKSQARKEHAGYKQKQADIEKEMKALGKEVWGPADAALKKRQAAKSSAFKKLYGKKTKR